MKHALQMMLFAIVDIVVFPYTGACNEVRGLMDKRARFHVTGQYPTCNAKGLNGTADASALDFRPW